MKKIFILIGLIGMSLTVKSQIPEQNDSSKAVVVINQTMIANFNSIEYSADNINFAYILTHYTLNETKDLMMAYRSGELETTTKQSVDTYLAENKAETLIPAMPHPNNTENKLLATQQ
jgi:hypothetical protein